MLVTQGNECAWPAVAALRRPAPHLPGGLCAGRRAHRRPAVREDILLAYAFGWAENMVQAAVKAVPLGQSAGQRILAAGWPTPSRRRGPRLPRLMSTAIARPSPRCWPSCRAQHEAQYSRLFRS
jgi:urease accessory protein